MGTKLLLADDSITIQKVVGIIFANEDYELTVVDNGISALERARESRPDVVLVDALMPGKSGYQVCAEAREDALLKDVPLLLLVGAFEPFDEEKARSCGADDFITKPFESQSLIDKVKLLVEIGSARRVVQSPPLPVAASQAVFETLADAGAVCVSTAAEAVTAPVAGGANLHDSFKGYERLGGASAPPVAEESAPAAPLLGDEPPLAAAREPEGVILLSSVDIVEAAPEDDPWGIFAEEIAEGEPIQFGEVLDEQNYVAADVEELEPFTLMDEETLDGDVEACAGEVEPLDFVDEAVYAEDELIGTSLAEDSDDAGGFAWATTSVGESISLGEVDAFQSPAATESFAAEQAICQETAAAVSLAEESTPFAPEEELIAVAPEELSVSQPVQPETAAAVQVPELSEDQLKAALALVSHDVIEKIVWEIVPDLAELIIKEEIRKIKEGMTR